MRKVSDEIKGLQVELHLTDTQKAILAAYAKMEGFDVIQALMEDQVRRFNLKLLNVENGNHDEVIAAHAMAKCIAQFYVGLIGRIAEECEINYSNAHKNEVVNEMHIEDLK